MVCRRTTIPLSATSRTQLIQDSDIAEQNENYFTRKASMKEHLKGTLAVTTCCAIAMGSLLYSEDQATASTVSAYCIEEYERTYEPCAHGWLTNNDGACEHVGLFTGFISAGVAFRVENTDVTRAMLQRELPPFPARRGSFDNVDMAYWHAHSHTLAIDLDVGETDRVCWALDPTSIEDWGTPSNPYLPYWSSINNPQWFEHPCDDNDPVSGGYVIGDRWSGKTVAFPTYHGYYGAASGESVLSHCELNYINGNGLGDTNLEWLIMDSCDSVRVAKKGGTTTFSATGDGVRSWDQSFDGLHGVFGYYVSVVECRMMKHDFTQFLNEGRTIWDAFREASILCLDESNKRAAVITAEKVARSRICRRPYGCMWIYSDPDSMAINDHWWGMSSPSGVSVDIPHEDIEFYYTQWIEWS